MVAPEDNENCHHVQNDPQRCKTELEIFCLISGGVTELLRKVSQGGGISPLPPPLQVR